MSVKYTSDVIPNIAGEELRDEIRPIRELYMPIRIQGINPSDLSLNKQNLRRSLVPANIVELWITNEMGDTRVCYCKYGEGFDKAVDDDKRSPVSINIPLKLLAFDPYFYDIPGNEIVHTVDYATTVVPFFNDDSWFSPEENAAGWRLNAQGVSREWTVFNDGEEDAYPVWTITGPGVAPFLSNLTTDLSFLLDYTLSAGEIITVDMRDNAHTVDSNFVGNCRKYMDADARTMWPLIPGPNDLFVELPTGTSTAGVSFSFLNRWEGI
jgi:hypothetical protein